MDRNVERTLREIEQRVGQLRAGLTDRAETLRHASLLRARNDAQRERELAARQAQIAALERQALANAGPLPRTRLGSHARV